MTTKPSGLANLAYRVLTVLFWVVIVGSVVAPVAMIAIDEVAIDGQLSRDVIGRVPDYVELPPRVAVTVPIESASLGDRALLAALVVVGLGFAAYGLHLLRGLVSSIRRGDPFNASNVSRLRRFGTLLIVAPFVFGVMQLLVGEAILTERPGVGMGLDIDLSSFVMALAVFVLAEVFAHGVRMREDLEGTV